MKTHKMLKLQRNFSFTRLEPLFQVVQADTGESDAIDLPGLTTADPDGVAEIARTHGVTPFAAFNVQP